MPGKKKDNNTAMLKLTPGQMKMIKSMMDENEGSESAATKKGKMKKMGAVTNKGSKYKGKKKK